MYSNDGRGSLSVERVLIVGLEEAVAGRHMIPPSAPDRSFCHGFLSSQPPPDRRSRWRNPPQASGARRYSALTTRILSRCTTTREVSRAIVPAFSRKN